MATTTTYSGSSRVLLDFLVTLGTDLEGQERAKEDLQLTWAAAGGSAPTVSGFLRGTLTAAAGDILLAHATDPFQAMGDSVYSQGFTPNGSKLKLLYLRNLDDTHTITVARGAANGLPIFDAAGDAVTIQPGGHRLFYDPTGLTAALTTGTNDKLTLAVSGGSPQLRVIAVYGP